jgi:hypothetical protein
MNRGMGNVMKMLKNKLMNVSSGGATSGGANHGGAMSGGAISGGKSKSKLAKHYC